jgi:putative ABC transport system permease protein
MFARLLWESFRRQRRRKALAGIAILLGTTAVTAMLALATTIGDRIHQELAVYGANIVVFPKAEQLDVKIGGVDVKPATGNAYLKESDLAKLQTIFWANNITGISPELDRNLVALVPNLQDSPNKFGKPVPVQAKAYWFNHHFGMLATGAPSLHPSWKLSGRWPVERYVNARHREDGFEVVLGTRIAEALRLRIGDWFLLASPGGGYAPEADVVGIVSTGDQTDGDVLMPLELRTIPTENGPVATNFNADISRIEISARTIPEDAFARKDPSTLSPQQHEIWYCRAYANSIAYQIREAIPGAQAEQVRQVEQSEGTVLSRISGLMWLVSAAALLAAGFAVSAAMATAVLERRGEIGLMRSLGASKTAIALLFYSETGLLAVVAGTLGYLLGSALAYWLGNSIFAGQTGSHIFNPVLLPVLVTMALLVAIAGSTPSIRAALRLDPTAILRTAA